MFTSDEIESLRESILQAADLSKYDHRTVMPASIGDAFPHMLEDCQLKYARLKLAVAEVLQPRTIYEVGVGWGVSALAFKEGCPSALFYGIDNADMGVDPSLAVHAALKTAVADSTTLQAFVHPDGDIDLIHIDGGHGLEHKANDIVKALEARPEWLLVDDVNNVMVAAGTFAGLYRAYRCPDLQMLYIGNSHTGNLLVHVNRQEPDYRGLEVRRT